MSTLAETSRMVHNREYSSEFSSPYAEDLGSLDARTPSPPYLSRTPTNRSSIPGLEWGATAGSPEPALR